MQENITTEEQERTGERFVIIGGGIAAVSAAEEIRRLLHTASIIIISEEHALPYDRTALSRHLILPGAGERFSLHPPEWYSLHGILLLSDRRATRLLPRLKQVELADGTVISYDKCILATGRECIVPALEGHIPEGVFTLRTLHDLEKLARHLRPDMRAVVLGGGPLGLESAWQLFLGGCHVTVMEENDRLLGGRLDSALTERLIYTAAQRGVEIRTGVRVTRLGGEDRVEQVILPGEYLNADLVLFCCGARPRTELAVEAGLEATDGIPVNSRMMTEKYGIYACGDCARLGQEVCHSAAMAENMGRCAGKNAAGEDALYRPTPCALWLDAFGLRLFAVSDCGTGSGTYTVERRPSGHGEAYLYRVGEHLCGAVLWNDTDEAVNLIAQLSHAGG